MKKIKKLIQTFLFFVSFVIIGVLIGSYKEGFKMSTFTEIWNLVFDRNLDFIIIGFVVLFIFNTEVIQNFIFKKFGLNFNNIDNDFFIYLFFIPIIISFISVDLLDLKIFSFLKPLSSRPELYVFCLSFILFFAFLYLFFLIGSIITKAPFLEYCILNSILISASISLFLSFFPVLFWKIRVNSSSPEEKSIIIFSLIVFAFASVLGKAFKKEEIKNEYD